MNSAINYIRGSILVAVAIALGFFVYSQYFDFGSSKVVDQDKNLTEIQKKILYFPSSTASVQEKKQHFDLVASQAVVSESIDINGCVATPMVYQMKRGDVLKIKNSSSVNISFSLRDVTASISAGQATTIKPDFKNAPGLYGFRCDDPNVNRPVGIIYVTP